MSAKNRGLRLVSKVVRSSCAKIRRHENRSQKELDRVTKIFRTVYKHAKKHGQSDKDAFKYCYNVYKEQAPAWALEIVNDSIRENTKMKITERQIRQIIREELSIQEADIIKFKGRSKNQDRPVSPEGQLLTPDFGSPAASSVSPAEPSVESDEDRARRQNYNAIVRQVRNIIEDELFMGGFSPLYKSNLEKLANMADDMLDIRDEDEDDLYGDEDESYGDEDEYLDQDEESMMDNRQAMIKSGLDVYRASNDPNHKKMIKASLIRMGVDPSEFED